jgi:flagellar motility protein MotE (MotC chaperone)
MNHNKDTLGKAINQMKTQPIAPDPPGEVTDATVARLRQAAEQPVPCAPEAVNLPQLPMSRPNIFRPTLRFAAAAAVFALAGYIAGRLTAPRPPDVKELCQALEPRLRTALAAEVRDDLLDQMDARWSAFGGAFAKSYLQLKDELGRQYRDDLNRFAAQTLAASNVATNQLLAELVQSIDKTQTQDMRRIAQAIYTVETNRLKDRTQLAKGLQDLALLTDEGFQRTKQDVFRLVANTRPDDTTQSPTKTLDSPDMRKD